MVTRYIEGILETLSFSRHKMAFVSGPRQCGKTTLAKALLRKRHSYGSYYNWDEKNFRRAWTKDPLHALQVPPQNGAAHCAG